MRTEGIDLENGGEPLLDLRFADDILVFATSSQQAAYLLDELVVALADVGLILNQDKTKLLTTQAQPPTTITTPGGLSVAVVDRDGCHKWLGCILSGNNRGSHRLDLEYHLQAASKTFFANRNILCNKAVSLVKRLQFFDKNCDSRCMFRRWPQKNLQNRSGNDGCSFSPVASICRRPPQSNKLAEPMARNFT